MIPSILPDKVNGLAAIKNIVPTSKNKLKSPYSMKASRIVVHNTANDAPARNEIKYMVANNLEVSYHFAVDEKEVVQGLFSNRNGWHAGDGNGKGNREGIGIEICYSKSGGSKFRDAEINASKLIAYILKENNWDISKVTKHQDYSGKYCPHLTLDLGWQRFLNMCKMELAKLNPTTSPIIPKEPFPVNSVIYNTKALILDSTVYQDDQKTTLTLNSKVIVNKYFILNNTLWMSLKDSNGKILNPASWTKELTSFTTKAPVTSITNPTLEQLLVNLRQEIKNLTDIAEKLEKVIK